PLPAAPPKLSSEPASSPSSPNSSPSSPGSSSLGSTSDVPADIPSDSVKPAMKMSDTEMRDMAGMNNDGTAHAMRSMEDRQMSMGPHMKMTTLRELKPGDQEKADQVVAAARKAAEKYTDYKVALSDGYKIFLPNLPQPQYHFTNYWNGFLESFSFDPSRPTSLLYKKTKTGYELIGAMYTMPKRVTEEQLNARIPLGVA